MSPKKRTHRAPEQQRGQRRRGRKAKLLRRLPAFLLVGVLLPSVWLILSARGSDNGKSQSSSPIRKVARGAKSLDDLLTMTAEQLRGVDIAEMNLLCTTGLSGAEKLDIDKCLARLDQWARHVKAVTERHLYRAHDPRYAEHYKHSENWLRAEMLAQVLQEDCGVHYNMERVRNIDFTKSKDLFIHGMIDDDNGGTCASMPVLYVAVGRRLGYPVKLVLTKAHVLARWDGADPKEEFNIETACNGGINSHPDEYYENWPEKWTDAEVKANRYLISLFPAGELACFLAARGHCLLDNGRTREARDAYAAAHRLAPQDPAYLAWTRQAEARLSPPRYAIAGGRRVRDRAVVRRNGPIPDIRGVEPTTSHNGRPMEQRMRPPVPLPYAPQPGMPHPAYRDIWNPDHSPWAGQKRETLLDKEPGRTDNNHQLGQKQ